MTMIKTYFPLYNSGADKKTSNILTNINQAILQDIDYFSCSIALLQYMSTEEKFPPTAGVLRETVLKIQHPFCTLKLIPQVQEYHNEHIARTSSLEPLKLENMEF